MKIVITGVAGLIGSRLARWIRQNVTDVDIIGIDDLSGGYRENVPPGITFGAGYTLGSGQHRFTTLCRSYQPDYVFHCAAFAAEGLSPFVREHTVKNTWLATAEVLNGCLAHPGLKRLIFLSSMAVYGNQEPPFSEDLERRPIDPYGVGKAACERDIEIAGQQHGLPWTIVRPHNVYGANQNLWQDYRNVLGIWMRQALQGRPLRVYGDGRQQRAFSAVDDCLPCLWEAATSARTASEIINLGGIHQVEILQAAELVREITGAPGIEHTKPRHEVRDAWATWQKSVDLLGYEDRTPLETGLAAMWAWERDAWERYPLRRDPQPLPIEVEAGLYPWWSNG